MSEADAMEVFERAFEEAVGADCSPDDIQHALDRMERRVTQLRIARGMGVDRDDE
jgi:hypothetical protein